MAVGAVMFGIDTGSFGSLQSLPSFLARFGERNDAGTHTLPAARASLMNSLPWIGKILGCLGAERFIEILGYKKTMLAAAVVQVIAIIIELTSRHWAQFTVGRIIAYAAVGLVENATPAYCAEVSPAAVRGFLSGSIMMITGLGNLWGAGMSRAYATEMQEKGWIIPTSMQLIPAVGLLLLVPFTQESPRWLILKERPEEAKKGLDKIRPEWDVQSGTTQAEIDALCSIIRDDAHASRHQGSWADLFRGNYLCRTWICATLFVLEQMNGNQFVQSYGATFYTQQGLGSMSFTYSTIGQVAGLVGSATGLVLFDVVGRRPPMIVGSLLCAIFLYLAAGVGLHKPLSTPAENTMLASFMLLPAFTRISATNTAFLTGAEIGGVHMRKKTMAFGTTCDVIAAFIVTFVTPYLMPTLGVKVGWIFGSVAAFAFIWSILFFPELKCRSLEEVDELFEANIHAWQFSRFETQGAGRILAVLENEGQVNKGGAVQEIEEAPTAQASTV